MESTHVCWLSSLDGITCWKIAEQLRVSKALLQLWQRYKDYFKQCAATAQQQEGRNQRVPEGSHRQGDVMMKLPPGSKIAMYVQEPF